MKQRLLLSVSLLILLFGLVAMYPQTTNSPQKLDNLNWLLDTWQRTNVRPGTTAFETWEKQNEQLYTGIGVSMKGSDTSFVEKLRIEVKDDKLYYVADVRENATPTYFLITEISKQGFKSANPEHDFPKTIDYNLSGDDLTVIISDGDEKKIGFQFKKGL